MWYGIGKVVVMAYHHQANTILKRSHKPIFNDLAKMSEEAQPNVYR